VIKTVFLIALILFCLVSCTSIYKELEIVDRSTAPYSHPKIWIYYNDVDIARFYDKPKHDFGVCDEFFKAYVHSRLVSDSIWEGKTIRRIAWRKGTGLDGRRYISLAVVYYE